MAVCVFVFVCGGGCPCWEGLRKDGGGDISHFGQLSSSSDHMTGDDFSPFGQLTSLNDHMTGGDISPFRSADLLQ